MQAVLFTLLSARVTREIACSLERGLICLVRNNESASDTVTDSSRLTRKAAAAYIDYHIERRCGAGKLQGLLDDELESVETEVLVQAPLVDGDSAVAFGEKSYAGDSFLPAACAEILNLLLNFLGSHCVLSLSDLKLFGLLRS